MEENPFSGMLNVIRKDREERTLPGWILGTVISAVPLVVRTNGADLSGGDLRVNRQLLPNTEAVALSKISGALTATGDCPTGNLTALTVTDGAVVASGLFGGVLVAGDPVALAPSADGQQFLVLCKVSV